MNTKSKLTKDQKKEIERLKKEADKLEQETRDRLISCLREAICDCGTRLRDNDSRLDFLTDIFCLTEDLRHDLSKSDTVEDTVFDNETVVVSSGAVGDAQGTGDRKEGSYEDNFDPCSEESIRMCLMARSKEFLVNEILFLTEKK